MASVAAPPPSHVLRVAATWGTTVVGVRMLGARAGLRAR